MMETYSGRFQVKFRGFLHLFYRVNNVLNFRALTINTISTSIVLNGRVMVNYIICTYLTFHFIRLMLLGINNVMFLGMPFRRVRYVSHPILAIALFRILLMGILLSVKFVNTCFLNCTSDSYFVVRRFASEHVRFIRFRSNVSVFLTSSRASHREVGVVPSLFGRPLRNSHFFNKTCLLALRILTWQRIFHFVIHCVVVCNYLCNLYSYGR